MQTCGQSTHGRRLTVDKLRKSFFADSWDVSFEWTVSQCMAHVKYHEPTLVARTSIELVTGVKTSHNSLVRISVISKIR